MNSIDNFDGFGGLRFYQKIHFKIIVLLLMVFAANYAIISPEGSGTKTILRSKSGSACTQAPS
jgi:hypothetical protein